MKQQASREEVIQNSRNYFKQLMDEARPRAFALNVSLTNNPFVRHKDSFKFLLAQLKDYNSRVERGAVSDPYEMLSYQKMHSMLSDLAQVGTRDDQLTALEAICTWFKEQQRILQQRCDQGEIRYQMTKQYRDALKYVPEKEEELHEEELNIPFYIIERIIEPYRVNERSLHGEYDVPTRRLL
jgi:hypothetical protein